MRFGSLGVHLVAVVSGVVVFVVGAFWHRAQPPFGIIAVMVLTAVIAWLWGYSSHWFVLGWALTLIVFQWPSSDVVVANDALGWVFALGTAMILGVVALRRVRGRAI
jgi:hypothetical protein